MKMPTVEIFNCEKVALRSFGNQREQNKYRYNM